MLHLLGYDHERGAEEQTAMRAREEAIMQQIGLPRE
jgi:probable rRNA maturation factor